VKDWDGIPDGKQEKKRDVGSSEKNLEKLEVRQSRT
jgi:hypothetical protein